MWHIIRYLNFSLYSGFTVVGHDLSENTPIGKCSDSKCFTLKLKYSGTVAQLKALTEISESCYQNIKVSKALSQ